MKRANRLWLIAPWALFALIAAAWSFYWFSAAARAKTALRDWVAAQNAAGAEVRLGALDTKGFPVLLRIQARDFSYAPASGDWRVATPVFELHLNLANAAQYGARAAAPIEITQGSQHASLTADGLVGALRFARDGSLSRVSLEGAGVRLDNPDAEGVLSVGHLVINARPDARSPGAWQLAFDAERIGLARPARGLEVLGQEIAALRARAVVEQARALTPHGEADLLQGWRDGGGAVRFEALLLDWSALQAEGEGEARLDADKRLEGALQLRLSEPAAALASLVQGEALGDRVTVEARDGALSVGGKRLRGLAPLY